MSKVILDGKDELETDGKVDETGSVGLKTKEKADEADGVEIKFDWADKDDENGEKKVEIKKDDSVQKSNQGEKVKKVRKGDSEGKVKTKKKLGKLKVLGLGCLTLMAIGLVSFDLLLYGPSNKFKDWLVTNAMNTLHHHYLATWFYSDEEIAEVMSRNRVIEVDENTDTDLITVGDVPAATQEEVVYANEYERQILEREEGQDYKIIELHEKNYDGYLAVIYEPSRVSVGTSKYLGSSGQYLTDIAKQNNATIAINGGGFADERW